jgi:hypothetical protein
MSRHASRPGIGLSAPSFSMLPNCRWIGRQVRRTGAFPVQMKMVTLPRVAAERLNRGCRAVRAMSMSRVPAPRSLRGRSSDRATPSLAALDRRVERPCGKRLSQSRARSGRAGGVLPCFLAHDLGMGACRSSGWDRRRGRRHLGELAFPAAVRIRVQARCDRGARSKFLPPVRGFGMGCGVAGPHPESAAAARIGRLSIASAGGW